MSGLVVDHLRLDVGGRAEIVTDVDLEIAPGTVFGLVGESGAGKTSVGLAVLGHVRGGIEIVDGAVRVDGRSILDVSPAQLRQLRGSSISYVAQDPGSALNPALRIGHQIRQVLDAHQAGDSEDTRRTRVGEVLAEVGLPGDPELLRRYPHQLSGGEQQRVALAIAFACRPAMIVLDEPTTGLDVTTQRHVLDTVNDMCREHAVAALYITHDLGVVARICDRLAVMYAGRVVEVGPTASVLANPAHPYTRHLVAATPDPAGRRSIVGLGGVAPIPGRRAGGCSFADRCELAHDACRAAVPALDEVAPGRSVRCVVPFAVPPGIVDSGPIVRTLPQGADPVLTVDGLTAAHGGRRATDLVTFEIERGECLALVGDSGAGKSTLVRSIGGLHGEWTGTVRLGGVALARAARGRTVEQRLAVQFVFQDLSQSLNPRRTIGESVGRPLRIGGSSAAASRHAVAEMLERVRLDRAVAARYPDQLSGGELQRAAIARALVARPELLICDEVTSALDNLVQAAIVDLLLGLQRDLGLSMLFVTHDLALVRSIAARVAVLADGRIVEIGPTDRVFGDPRSDHAMRMMAALRSP